MGASIFSLPIREGRSDDFRAFVDDLMHAKRIDWAQSQRRRGITRQVVGIAHHDGQDLALIWVEGSDPERVLVELRASDDPFDKWLASQLAELTEERLPGETIADTAPKPGPWSGWRRIRR